MRRTAIFLILDLNRYQFVIVNDIDEVTVSSWSGGQTFAKGNQIINRHCES